MKDVKQTTRKGYVPPQTDISEIASGQLICASVDAVLAIENLQLNDEFDSWTVM